jgi:hypothetical protein
MMPNCFDSDSDLSGTKVASVLASENVRNDVTEDGLLMIASGVDSDVTSDVGADVGSDNASVAPVVIPGVTSIVASADPVIIPGVTSIVASADPVIIPGVTSIVASAAPAVTPVTSHATIAPVGSHIVKESKQDKKLNAIRVQVVKTNTTTPSYKASASSLRELVNIFETTADKGLQRTFVLLVYRR